MPRTTFPPDHPIEALRGYRVSGRAEVKRALAARCAWLAAKIARRSAVGEPSGAFLSELAAMAVLAEFVDYVEEVP